MTTETTNALTEKELESNRRKLLNDILEEALDGEWTPEKSEMVDLIGEGGYCG